MLLDVILDYQVFQEAAILLNLRKQIQLYFSPYRLSSWHLYLLLILVSSVIYSKLFFNLYLLSRQKYLQNKQIYTKNHFIIKVPYYFINYRYCKSDGQVKQISKIANNSPNIEIIQRINSMNGIRFEIDKLIQQINHILIKPAQPPTQHLFDINYYSFSHKTLHIVQMLLERIQVSNDIRNDYQKLVKLMKQAAKCRPEQDSSSEQQKQVQVLRSKDEISTFLNTRKPFNQPKDRGQLYRFLALRQEKEKDNQSFLSNMNKVKINHNLHDKNFHLKPETKNQNTQTQIQWVNEIRFQGKGSEVQNQYKFQFRNQIQRWLVNAKQKQKQVALDGKQNQQCVKEVVLSKKQVQKQKNIKKSKKLASLHKNKQQSDQSGIIQSSKNQQTKLGNPKTTKTKKQKPSKSKAKQNKKPQDLVQTQQKQLQNLPKQTNQAQQIQVSQNLSQDENSNSYHIRIKKPTRQDNPTQYSQQLVEQRGKVYSFQVSNSLDNDQIQKLRIRQQNDIDQDQLNKQISDNRLTPYKLTNPSSLNSQSRKQLQPQPTNPIRSQKKSITQYKQRNQLLPILNKPQITTNKKTNNSNSNSVNKYKNISEIVYQNQSEDQDAPYIRKKQRFNNQFRKKQKQNLPALSDLKARQDKNSKQQIQRKTMAKNFNKSYYSNKIKQKASITLNSSYEQSEASTQQMQKMKQKVSIFLNNDKINKRQLMENEKQILQKLENIRNKNRRDKNGISILDNMHYEQMVQAMHVRACGGGCKHLERVYSIAKDLRFAGRKQMKISTYLIDSIKSP